MTYYPRIIQGGMGVAVSNWRLARAVSKYGQLGVVSGTFIDSVVARRLQDGDVDGSMRRAFEHFPLPSIAQRVWDRYFISGGKSKHVPYRSAPMHSLNSPPALTELTIVANFAEVYLAKEGHPGLVGINYLMKIDLPTLPSLYGAMLAGVDYVLMGAGIPKAIPGILDQLSNQEVVSLKLDVLDAEPADDFKVTFDPATIGVIPSSKLKRPKFLPIVSSTSLALALAKKSSGKIDGYIVEHHTAGGHNAPPRGGVDIDANGEPIYGIKDECNLADFQKLGLPFWLAGSYGSPERLAYALESGANGIQVGTPFAFCRESGIADELKARVIEQALRDEAAVFTDPLASASRYPFKVVQLSDTVSQKSVYEARPRICDLGYLRTAYKKNDGTVGFRCPAEPSEDYVRKGGRPEDVREKKCLCNGLMSTVGYPQVQKNGYLEPPLVTAGKQLPSITRFLVNGQTSYSAEDVLRILLEPVKEDELQKEKICAAH